MQPVVMEVTAAFIGRGVHPVDAVLQHILYQLDISRNNENRFFFQMRKQMTVHLFLGGLIIDRELSIPRQSDPLCSHPKDIPLSHLFFLQTNIDTYIYSFYFSCFYNRPSLGLIFPESYICERNL